MLSIIIPALNAAGRLEGVLKTLFASAADKEVIVADGGSADATREIAERLGARVIKCVRGRGAQMACGAAAAKGDRLLFIHADTVPGAGWDEAVARYVADPGNLRRAAVFRLRLDDASPAARRLERLVAWRSRVLGLPYGDQGLLISRVFYDELGGFRAIALMEDVDIVCRIGKSRLDILDVVVVTSAERYRTGGYLLRPLRNMLCLGLYFLGLPPRLIAKIYE